jgi:hypothetical protein
VLAVGLFFGQLLQLSHLLLIPHRTCEHGELTHVHRGDAPSLARASHAGTLELKEERLDRLPTQARGEHDHCDVNALRHRESQVGPWVGEANLLLRIDVPALSSMPERRPIALLCVAPKSSPPHG